MAERDDCPSSLDIENRSQIVNELHKSMLELLSTGGAAARPMDFSKDHLERMAKTAYNSFIIHGHNEGIEALLDSFSLPSNALQTALALGREETLEFLLKVGALETWKRSDEAACRGSCSPVEESVDRCRTVLSRYE